jgi:hypothetical protein
MEGFLLAQYLQARSNGRSARQHYQELAEIARAPFASRFPVGPWAYYESMEEFYESGAFDRNPGGPITPEMDTTTFNGFTWQLARRTFWDNPAAPPPRTSQAFQRALDYYRQHAVQPEFRWSWRNATLEQDLYRRAVRHSNGAFRRASDDLTLILANHVLSAVDAFVVLRLTGVGSPANPYRVSATVPWPARRQRGTALPR